MATTSLWSVKGYLGNLVLYIENPEKTTDPKTFTDERASEHSLQALSDVISYAKRDDATFSQQLVHGVNCYHKTARDEMMAVKKRFGKIDGVIAYHGYQSFKPGEVSPERAHEIGIKLAEKCWGDKYQVLVATHVDKEHVHNHFLINTVSQIDGRKFHRTKQDYAAMREGSDKLCREYGLSIVEQSKGDSNRKHSEQIYHLVSKAMSYAEWQEKKQGKLTWKEAIKVDLDYAISQSIARESLTKRLEKMGYEVKWGSELSLKAPDRERFLRPHRHFGGQYTTEGITNMLQRNYNRGIKPQKRPTLLPKTVREVNQQLQHLNPISFSTRYYKYCLLISLYATVPLSEQTPNLRAETRVLEALIRQSLMLLELAIDTIEELLSIRAGAEQKLTTFQKERARLYKIAAKSDDPQKVADAHERLAAIKAERKPIRLMIRDCDGIAQRSLNLDKALEELSIQQDRGRTR